MGFKRKFSEGDKAIVKETKQVVTVGSYINRDYRVRFEDGSYGYYRAEKLEKYEEKTALFKVGDRVKYVSKEPYDGKSSIIGELGTVVYTEDIDNKYEKRVGVEFDKNINGHTCVGCGKNGHCWHVPVDRVEKVKTEYSTLKTDNSDPREWEVGDKVVVVRSFEGVEVGTTGTVIEKSNSAGVEFDKYIGAHSCGGRGKSGYCLWITRTYRNDVKRIAKKEEPAKMPELKTGMKVELRGGRMGLIVENANVMTDGEQKFAILLKDGFCFADEYSDDKMKSGFSGLDIVKVYANLTSDGRAVICSHTLDVDNISGYTEIWSKDATKKITKKQAETELSEVHGVKVVIEG